MRHVGDRERHDLGGALSGARQPAALDPRQMFSHHVHLADRRAGAQQCAVHLLLLRERDAVGRRDPVGRAAAGQQHQQEIVGGRLRAPVAACRRRLQPGFVGHGMAGLDHPDAPRRHAVAVAGGGDAGQALRLESERVEIMPLRRRRQRGGALAGGKADHPAFRAGRRCGRQHDVGMRGRDGRIEDRAQERASVGHRSGSRDREWEARLSIQSRKRKPPRAAPRGSLEAANRPDQDSDWMPKLSWWRRRSGFRRTAPRSRP